MARAFTQVQRDLLRAPSVRIRLLVTFFLDEGTYRFCDDVMDATDGVDTYLGASALTEAIEVRSGRDLAAEPITLICDGNRMAQHGIADPARVLSDMLGYLYQQRRVDFAYGISYPDQASITLRMPVAAMKINYARLIDSTHDLEGGDQAVPAKLEIVFDSLAARYSRSTFRTRSNGDQHEIDPTDNFFSFASDVANVEKTIYWGKKAPRGNSNPGGVPGGGGGGSRGSLPGVNLL